MDSLPIFLAFIGWALYVYERHLDKKHKEEEAKLEREDAEKFDVASLEVQRQQWRARVEALQLKKGRQAPRKSNLQSFFDSTANMPF